MQPQRASAARNKQVKLYLYIKNPHCNAGDAGSIPGLGTEIPHAMEKIRLNAVK